MHEGAYKFVYSMLEQLEPRLWVVELGSRTVAGDWPYSGPVRPLFTDARHYVGVDIAEGPNVDIVGNAATWRGPVADTVVCCETLEHTDEAEAICHNAHAMLGPGGVFLMTTAGMSRAPHSAVDGGPIRDGEFYRNITRKDLREWLAPFHFWLIDESMPGDIYALAVK